jgi:hypothetical protein
MNANIINLTGLTDRDLDALLDVAAGTEGASLEGLTPNGQMAVAMAFRARGVSLSPGYWQDGQAPVTAGGDGNAAEAAIIARQDADESRWG